MSLSQPAALGPRTPNLQLLAALFQNPVRLKGHHSIFLREKLSGRGEGCRVSTEPGCWVQVRGGRSSPCCGTCCIFPGPAISSQWYLVQRVIPSEMHPHSSLHLLSKTSPKPRAVHPPAALEVWVYTTTLRCRGRGLHSARLSTCCRGSWIQTVDFQHASFSCKPTSAPHKLPAAFAGMLAGLPG